MTLTENYTKVTPAEIAKGNVFLYEYNDAMNQVKVLSGVLKGDRVTIEFLTGTWAGQKMTCKIEYRLWK